LLHCADEVATHNDIDHLIQFGRASMIPLGFRVLIFGRPKLPETQRFEIAMTV
jgi:hypothetical protein